MRVFLFLISLILTCILSINLSAQGSEKEKVQTLFLNGYVKNLQTLSQLKNTDPILELGDDIFITDLIHNRLNLKWYPSDNFTFALESRNRLFIQPWSYTSFIDTEALGKDIGYIDLSFIFLDKTFDGPSQLVGHSQIDRAWLSYSAEKFDIKLGRQRVNWGINTVWNPNDIFNSYNFLDFDYEERSGTDAIRGTYFINDVSSIELVVGSYPELNQNTETAIASKYSTNIKNYDLQVIAGLANNDLTGGLGFAGNLGNAGLKGEAQYFTRVLDDNLATETQDVLNASLTLDYVFKGAIYTFISGLYSSGGQENPSINGITPKYLFPYKWTTMISASGGFSPIGNAAAAVVYAPEDNVIIFTPSATLALSESWDVALFSQIFWAENHTLKVQNLSNSFFLRLKWSF